MQPWREFNYSIFILFLRNGKYWGKIFLASVGSEVLNPVIVKGKENVYRASKKRVRQKSFKGLISAAAAGKTPAD
jgi:hypothetical protein